MPTDGLSLVGFMDRQQAIQHLTTACVPENSEPENLTAEWTAAKAALGEPVPRAGKPEILPLPGSIDDHVQQLLTRPPFQSGGELRAVDFRLIEIAPLLAFQTTIDLARSQHYVDRFSAPPTMIELAQCCLPLDRQNEAIQTFSTPGSMLIQSRSMDVRATVFGIFRGDLLGITFGVKLPYLYVMRHEGRCYLVNGFHRAYALSRAGVTHAPCVFRDVTDPAAIGLRPGNFEAPLLESSNPPTLAHFIEGRAHRVRLRALSRLIQVSWAEYAIPIE